MRFLLKVSIPTVRGNAAIKDGSLMRKLGQILEELKPEAAYFTEEDGLRTGFIVVDMQDVSQIPALAEPFFLALDARVSFHPAMVIEDLQKAGPAFERVIKTYG